MTHYSKVQHDMQSDMLTWMEVFPIYIHESGVIVYCHRYLRGQVQNSQTGGSSSQDCQRWLVSWSRVCFSLCLGLTFFRPQCAPWDCVADWLLQLLLLTLASHQHPLLLSSHIHTLTLSLSSCLTIRSATRQGSLSPAETRCCYQHTPHHPPSFSAPPTADTFPLLRDN